eukprot:TRINITY_DN11517_c3_g1_i5.p1 TRINITY_DN11517_c3_g1~~TRINITY_DN11517_c3_g1_i5.p1  ORF type:complete len:121 (+),score=24.76 TRINITY_DN11517_c3_g1_i5:195-557(+)
MRTNTSARVIVVQYLDKNLVSLLSQQTYKYPGRPTLLLYASRDASELLPSASVLRLNRVKVLSLDEIEEGLDWLESCMHARKAANQEVKRSAKLELDDAVVAKLKVRVHASHIDQLLMDS